MPNVTEYWLQKKAFNSWSHVTWYATEAEVIAMFDRASVEGNGYSWRWVKVEVGGERLLNGERAVMRDEGDDNEWAVKMHVHPTPPIKNSGWTATPAASGWGKPAVKAEPVTEVIKSEHGSVGLIWLGNPVTKEKRRVVSFEAAKMLNEGWIKAGPRTVL